MSEHLTKNHLSKLTVNLPAGTASNLIEVLQWRATHEADELAILFMVDGADQTEKHTYASLDRRARSIGHYLMQQGQKGDRIMMQFQPGLAFIETFYGCLYANMVAIPLYPHTRPKRDQILDRIVNVAADCNPILILHDDSIAKVKERNLEQAPELKGLAWQNISNIPDSYADLWQMPSIDPLDLAFLQYTSGSTGDPKGVMVSHSNIIENSYSISLQYEVSKNDRVVAWLPPYHDMGLIGGIIQPVYAGFESYLMPPVYFLQRPFRYLKAITKYKGTLCGGPNFTFEYCVKKVREDQLTELDLSHMNRMFNGAEPISAEAIHGFTHKFRAAGFDGGTFFNCYGLAEATLMLSGKKPPLTIHVNASAIEENRVEVAETANQHTKELVSSGNVITNVTLKIVHPETKTICHTNEIGEIWAKGHNNAQGYWNRPEQSKETFDAYTSDTNEGPFMRTGDLGFFYDGELFVTGRIKDLIIIDGSNYYPQDIEWTVENVHTALRTHGTAAFGVSQQGSEKLVIVCEIDRRAWRDAAALGEEGMRKAIISAVSRKHDLSVHDLVLTTERIPKTTSGKIRHRQCRKEYLAGKYTNFFSEL